MRYELQHSGIKCNLFDWALPLKIGWDKTCKKGECIRCGVLIYFLCFYVYAGIWDNDAYKKQVDDTYF